MKGADDKGPRGAPMQLSALHSINTTTPFDIREGGGPI